MTMLPSILHHLQRQLTLDNRMQFSSSVPLYYDRTVASSPS
jgi:hypothetical protein